MRYFPTASAAIAALLIFSPPCPADEKPTLNQLIKSVQSQEALYNRIEMKVVYEYGELTRLSVRPRLMYRDHLHVVRAGEKFYSKAIRSHFVNEDGDRTVRTVTTAAYDGRQSRSLYRTSNQGQGSIFHHRNAGMCRIQPNTMQLWEPFLRQPFSRFLRIRNRGYTNFTWRVAGTETIDGLKCIKLNLKWSDALTGNVSDDTTFWLATDRNLQAVKVVALNPLYSERLPVAVMRVTKFREIDKGVWLPARVERTTYDTAFRNGEQYVDSRASFTLIDAKRNPRIDPALFASVKFPKGILVTEICRDQPPNTYRQK